MRRNKGLNKDQENVRNEFNTFCFDVLSMALKFCLQKTDVFILCDSTW